MEVLLTVLASMVTPDERFITHRYTSTRFAMILGMVSILVWFNYEFLVNHQLRWDLAIVAGIMAAAKLLAMAYLQVAR